MDPKTRDLYEAVRAMNAHCALSRYLIHAVVVAITEAGCPDYAHQLGVICQADKPQLRLLDRELTRVLETIGGTGAQH